MDGPLDARAMWCFGAAVGCCHVSGDGPRLRRREAEVDAWAGDLAARVTAFGFVFAVYSSTHSFLARRGPSPLTLSIILCNMVPK